MFAAFIEFLTPDTCSMSGITPERKICFSKWIQKSEAAVNDTRDLDHLLAKAEAELAGVDARRVEILEQIRQLKSEKQQINLPASSSSSTVGLVMNGSPKEMKISLFRSLFKGREDVYPRRFESITTGKTGYQPACRNEWVRPMCRKPATRCGACENRELIPVSDEVIRNHLQGVDTKDRSKRDFTMGVYPLLVDETCWFLAADFDKRSWIDDASAFLETCKAFKVPAALERSRSGNGGHIWVFFSEPVPAGLARQMGSFILTETMERRPEIGLDSYDRFFPNQDTMPEGGFGNLIALPLQKKPREKGNSLFLGEGLSPYPDQWAFLSTIRRMRRDEVEAIASEAIKRGRVVGVRMVVTDEEDDTPWTAPPSRRQKHPPIPGPLPAQITLVLGNQIYVPKDELTPALKNRLIRLAAFQNPEFYKAQAMRHSTYQIPRIISCCEEFQKHIGLPRGCLEEVRELFRSLRILPVLLDERLHGTPIDVAFQGTLRLDQEAAVRSHAASRYGRSVRYDRLWQDSGCRLSHGSAQREYPDSGSSQAIARSVGFAFEQLLGS